MSKRRRYRQPGVSCAQVARELGIAANLLSRWKRYPSR